MLLAMARLSLLLGSILTDKLQQELNQYANLSTLSQFSKLDWQLVDLAFSSSNLPVSCRFFLCFSLDSLCLVFPLAVGISRAFSFV